MPEQIQASRLGILEDVPTHRPATVDCEIVVLPPALRFVLRVTGGAVPASPVAGFDLARPINTVASSGERIALRLGPDEWLLIADHTADSQAITASLMGALGQHGVSLVDVSHRNIGLELTGDATARVLNAGCPLDLDDRKFPAGMATRTLLGKAEIVLARLSDEPRYRIEVWRSFGPYVHAFLAEAAAGCGD
jgi:sarcosine oxidase, subunit gamma